MAAPIETDVKGSPGTCREAADWLGTLSHGADDAAKAIRDARAESDASWHGAAGDAFRASIDGVDRDTIEVADKSVKVANALKDFAGALDSIAQKMAQARSQAQSGGLTVTGTVILPPQPPGPAPIGVCTQSNPSGAPEAGAQGAAEMQAHQKAMDAYNAQVGVFNQVLGAVNDARGTEKQAHETLNKAMTETEGETNNLKTIGVTAASKVLDAIKGTHEQAEELSTKAEAFSEAADTYQKFATGHLALMSPAEAALIERLGKESDQLATINAAKASQLESWIKLVPDDARRLIAANPGALVEGSQYLKYAKPFLKNMPYLGSALTVGSEVLDVATEGKDPGKAAVDAGTDIAGTAAGGAVGEAAGGVLGGIISGAEVGFIGGSEVPGLGNAVGAVVGGVVGGFVGSTVAKDIVNSF